MKGGLLIVLLGLLSGRCFGQFPALMYDSKHAVWEDSVGTIKKIASPYGKNLKVVYKNGQKRKILKSGLWGFRDRSGKLYRLYDNKAMRVLRQSDLIKYAYKQPGTHHFSWRYSTDLDSPVVRTKRKARHLSL
ncbi:hypothetical protein FEM33_23340 [Dyadobacter flavalbus]|uniref:WG repeat-containing protein n=1 Tax=Dyadobacter flavalbus TaxID=2579942 RepID=A0A5M8QCN1_9BACT|nr:hypothetical protein [Dyadobacter flavalbus]KAA6432660.1 hypothetical protein FEM33_23340 [Dyadobacter flavalbus]